MLFVGAQVHSYVSIIGVLIWGCVKHKEKVTDSHARLKKEKLWHTNNQRVGILKYKYLCAVF